MKVPDPNPVQKNFHEVIEINDELTHAQAKKISSKKSILNSLVILAHI